MKLAADNKLNESIIEFEKALKIEPKNVLLLSEIGNSYKALNRLTEAEEYYNKVLNSAPDYKLLYPNYSNLMLAKKDNVNAIKYGKIGYEVSETSEQKASCLFDISAGYYNIDSCEQAIKYFKLIKKLRNGAMNENDMVLLEAINNKCKTTL